MKILHQTVFIYGEGGKKRQGGNMNPIFFRPHSSKIICPLFLELSRKKKIHVGNKIMHSFTVKLWGGSMERGQTVFVRVSFILNNEEHKSP